MAASLRACPHCGSPNDLGAERCHRCGQPLYPEAAPQGVHSRISRRALLVGIGAGVLAVPVTRNGTVSGVFPNKGE
jgi:hypothetical protein